MGPQDIEESKICPKKYLDRILTYKKNCLHNYTIQQVSILVLNIKIQNILLFNIFINLDLEKFEDFFYTQCQVSRFLTYSH